MEILVSKVKCKSYYQAAHTHHVLYYHSEKDTKVNFSRDWKHFLDFIFLSWKSKNSKANL